MQKIEWNDSFSVGSAEIDAQHKKWIALYNDLIDHFEREDRGKSDLNIMETLKSILDYTDYHFDAEKEYMKSIHYPNIVGHIRKHKEFDDLIYKLNRSIAEGKTLLYSEVMGIIKHWLLEHILKEDKKYFQFALEQKG